MDLAEVMDVIRAGLAATPSDVSHVVGQPPRLEEIFTPTRHSLALDPDSPIVVGARGTGKSFWASIFTDDATRQAVAPTYPRLKLDSVVARAGFVDQAIGTAVSRATMDEVAGFDEVRTARLWLLIAIRAAEDVLGIPTFASFEEAYTIYNKSEAIESRLRALDEILSDRGIKLVVVFDALDRLSNRWDRIRLRTSSLLEALLALRAYRSIRFKLFMRPEQLSSVPAAFTDLSKLKAGSFDLRWSQLDLYGLLFSDLLRREETSEAFKHLLSMLRIPVSTDMNNIFQLPGSLLHSSPAQERLFVRIAGPYMGADARRGRTYTWLPNHLSDTKGRVTPRSFLTALGAAARHEREPILGLALTIDGIKHGVSEASVLRVEQLKDEYGWIDLALQPLAGQEVPCYADAIYDRWHDADTLHEIERDSSTLGYLPPFLGSYSDADANFNLLKALMDIGVIEVRSDGRVNIPDLFRIAALMLRRGGPRPLARG